MSMLTSQCQYQDPDNIACPNEAEYDGCCYWHSESADKSSPDFKYELQSYAQSGGFLRGISLKNADLSYIDLVNHNHKDGYDFSFADLYRCSLKGAHLFNINLHNASLMKADLRGANLNCAQLNGTNLLGIKWTNCKIQNLSIDHTIRQEKLAKLALKRGDSDLANDYFQQAEEIYRDLRKHAEYEGIFAMAGEYIQQELTMRRLRLPYWSIKRLTSKVIDLFCGYGEAPLRIVGISILLIFICALMYMVTGINNLGIHESISTQSGIEQIISLFFSCLYYSVVTFTTLGYGDITPIGFSRAIAAFEAFTGSFTIALFVVVFVKKMTR